MNTNFIRVLAILIIFMLVESCNETLVDENLQEDLELKSANTNKKGYIVILNDSELNNQLTKLKGYKKKQVAVKLKSQYILKRVGILDGEIEHVYGSALKGFSVKIALGQLKKLQGHPSILRISEDKTFSLGNPDVQPFRPGKGKKPIDDGGGDSDTTPAQRAPWGINSVGGAITQNAKTAWIIDSGIDLDHPDLNVDLSRDKSFIISRKATSPDDQHGHGTHVAGTIAALDNGYGVVGVAPGTIVVSLRVLDRRGTGNFSWTVAALDYLHANGNAGDVANLSLGPSSPYIDSEVDNAVQAVAAIGIKIAIAAGNESDDASLYSPAHVNGTGIYTISAMNENHNWASFSNYGEPVDFCAPGVSILSCYKDGGYATMSGTSMAAPHVAGLLLSGWDGVSFQGFVSGGDQTPDKIAHR